MSFQFNKKYVHEVSSLKEHCSSVKRDNSSKKFLGIRITTVCISVKDLLPGAWYPKLSLWTLSLYNISVFLFWKFLKTLYKKLAVLQKLQWKMFGLSDLIICCLDIFVLHQMVLFSLTNYLGKYNHKRKTTLADSLESNI